MSPEQDTEYRFVVDHMLGSLARWLRMLGYDSFYNRDAGDAELFEIAEKENRIILTRDKELAERGQGYFVPSTSLEDQLAAVGRRYGLSFRPDRIRCSVCNGELDGIEAAEVRELVPKKSLDNSTEFWRCGDCGKIYWNGTHWDKILERFQKLDLIGGE